MGQRVKCGTWLAPLDGGGGSCLFICCSATGYPCQDVVGATVRICVSETLCLWYRNLSVRLIFDIAKCTIFVATFSTRTRTPTRTRTHTHTYVSVRHSSPPPSHFFPPRHHMPPSFPVVPPPPLVYASPPVTSRPTCKYLPSLHPRLCPTATNSCLLPVRYIYYTLVGILYTAPVR